MKLRPLQVLKANWHLVSTGRTLAPVAASFYELMTAPTTKVLSVRPSVRPSVCLTQTGPKLKLVDFVNFTMPPQILDKWFDSEPLKATLATDSCIGEEAPN